MENFEIKKILIVTDSLGLGRHTPEKCSFQKTWPSLLKKKGYEIYQVSIGGATISDLYRQIHYHLSFIPDLVVFQCGIVDCAPRALSQFEAQIINGSKITRHLLGPLIKKYAHHLRKYRGITYTSSKVFMEKIIDFENLFTNQNIIWIGILKAQAEYEKKLPNISKNVLKYNIILNKTTKHHFISPQELSINGIMSDSIHLNELGHEFIFNKVNCKIRNLNS